MSNPMSSGDLEKPEKKFFFNTHIFDKNGVDLVALAAKNAAPPPPVYTEQDLENARKLAFAEGKSAAEKAYAISHENRVALLLESLKNHIGDFFEDEAYRESLYEQEVLHLTSSIFEILFPVYKNTIGFEELKTAIQKTVEAHNGKNIIRITVHNEMLEGIRSFAQTLTQNAPELRLSVAADDTLDVMAYRMNWDYGGALRDTQAMALEIQHLMQESLAANAAKGHDKEGTNKTITARAKKAKKAEAKPEDGEPS